MISCNAMDYGHGTHQFKKRHELCSTGSEVHGGSISSRAHMELSTIMWFHKEHALPVKYMVAALHLWLLLLEEEAGSSAHNYPPGTYMHSDIRTGLI